MRATLLKSVINFTIFWWIVGFVTFSVADPSINAEILHRLADFLEPHIILEVPERVSALTALGVQMQVLRYWSIPVGTAAAVLFTAGYLLSWLVVFGASHKRRSREKGKGLWRGMGVTLGAFPMPVALPRAPIKLKCSGVVAQGLARMPAEVRQLTQEILELLAAHPKAYVGDGHGEITLLEHTLNVMRRGFDVEDADPLLPAVLAGHDMGKTTAFIRRGEEWLAVRPHDKESGRLLALLPSYWSLTQDDRKLIAQAIRYSHSLWDAPHDGVDMDRLKRLINQMKLADGEATAEEKQDVLEKLPLPEIAFRAFLSVLPELPFQEPGLPRKTAAAGWRVDNRVYLLENLVRDSAIAKLDKHTAAALGGRHREQAKVAKYTANLLMAFDEAGWLVKKIGKARTPVDEALWRIKAGNCTFKGVIILDLPEDKLSLLPKHNTIYEINVTSQQFPPSGSISSANLSLKGLLGDGDPGKEHSLEKPESTITPAPVKATAEPDSLAGKGKHKPEQPTPPATPAYVEPRMEKSAEPSPVVASSSEALDPPPPPLETESAGLPAKRKQRRVPTTPAAPAPATPAAKPASPTTGPAHGSKPKKAGLLPPGLLK